MGQLRQIKKHQNNVVPSSMTAKLEEAWVKGYSRGFEQGAKEQRQLDIENTAKMLEGLEDIKGVGEKTAWKIREHVMQKFSGV